MQILKKRVRGPTREVGTFKAETQNGKTTVKFAGPWDVPTVMEHERALVRLAIETEDAQQVSLDLTEVTRLDTVGAIAVTALRDRSARGHAEIVGARPAEAALLGKVSEVDAQPIPSIPKTTIVDKIADLGRWTYRKAHEAKALIGYFGELSVVLFRLALHPRRIRWASIVSHMQQVGIDAMPIVGLLSFLIGVVLTFISGDQLQKFGAGIFIVNLIGLGVLRELGILITAIIVAGRSGSAFTAEIGTMQINQEVDAMRTIGLDPMEILVVPRTVALILMLIPLGFFADMIQIAGGALMAYLTLGVTFTQFFTQFQAAVGLQHLWVGMIKAPIFAFVIAMVGCFHGMQVSGSAESVGQQTTLSVVQSIFLVIVIDAIFAVVFEEIGF
jgi:phospholipid/cholesterol/gamma-HCH transport system permease protein